MPIVPTTPYNVGEDITTLVRALCNDQQGQLFTDTYLLPYVNSAYRQVQIALANIGKLTFIQDEYVVTIPAIAQIDPGLRVVLSFTGITGNIPTPANSPTLPQNLLEPLSMWERPTGSTDEFLPMVNLSGHGGIQDLPQSFNLRFWEWVSDHINFLGAEQETDIRLRFNGGFTPFVISGGSISGTLQVLDALDAVSYLAAFMALKPRGSPLANDYSTAASSFVEQLKNQEMRAQQHAGPYRRRGFSSRYGVGRGWY